MKVHGTAALVCALIASACSDSSSSAGDGMGATTRGSFEPSGQFEVLSVDAFEADHGFLSETETGSYVYYVPEQAEQAEQATICRRWVDQQSEVCIADERFSELLLRAWRASDSKLLLDDAFLGPGDGKALLVDFDSKTVQGLDFGRGRVSALSPDGDRVLLVDLREATLTVTRLDGSQVEQIPNEMFSAAGRWGGNDEIWLSFGFQLVVYDVGNQQTRASVDSAESWWLEVRPELQAGLAADFTSLAMMQLSSNSIVFVDLVSGKTIPVLVGLGLPDTPPEPSEDGSFEGVRSPLLLALGIAPDGEHVAFILERLGERANDEPVTELYVNKIDRQSGTAQRAHLVHTFDQPLEIPFVNTPARIAIDEDGTLTWFTTEGLMTVNLGDIPG